MALLRSLAALVMAASAFEKVFLAVAMSATFLMSSSRVRVLAISASINVSSGIVRMSCASGMKSNLLAPLSANVSFQDLPSTLPPSNKAITDSALSAKFL